MGVTVATIRAAAKTTEETQDFTTTDLGGLTPKAFLILATRATADGTAADGAGWYIGAGDGTNEWANTYEDEHAQASTDGYANLDLTANRVLTIHDGGANGTVEATADFDSFITNGVRINWTDAPAAAYLVTVILFAGSDLTAKVGNSDLGNTANAAIDITTVGFEADDVICAALIPDDASHSGYLGLGFVHNDRAGGVTQRCAALVTRGFSTSQLGAQVRSDACILKLINSNQATDWYGTAGSFDSSGFTIQLGNSRTPANSDLGWIALRYGASPVISSKVYTYSTPTSTGSNTDAGAGFEPQAVMYIPTYCAVAGTTETDADAGTMGLSVIDVAKAYSNSVQSEDGQADSDTQSMSDDKAINLPTDAGATGIKAAFTSFGATGVTLNFTAVAAAAKLVPAIAWGINASGGPAVSVSDTVTLSEALTLLVNSYISTSETVTLSEVASVLLVHLVSSEDTITLSETVSALLVSLVSVSDTVTLSEAVLLEIFTFISVSETITLSEAVTLLVTSSVSVSDTVTLSEDALALLVSLVSADDTVTLSESTSALIVSLVSVSETVTLEEALNLLVTSFISGSETITLSEDTSLTIVSAGDTLISVSDTITLSEVATLLVLSFISASETVTLSEALDLLVTSFIAASETITLSEDTSLSIVSGATFSPNVSDTITLSEAVSLFVLVEVSASETITLSELASLILVSLVDSSETVTLSEAITALLVSLISASETVALSEAVTLFVLATIQASETITLSESATVTLANLISASDTVTLSEAAAALLISLISASDTITLSETTSATVGTGINVSETITLTEQPTVTVTGAGGELLISVSETITLTESVSAIILIIGLMRITFSAKRPGASFSGKRPSITFTSEE